MSIPIRQCLVNKAALGDDGAFDKLGEHEENWSREVMQKFYGTWPLEF